MPHLSHHLAIDHSLLECCGCFVYSKKPIQPGKSLPWPLDTSILFLKDSLGRVPHTSLKGTVVCQLSCSLGPKCPVPIHHCEVISNNICTQGQNTFAPSKSSTTDILEMRNVKFLPQLTSGGGI